MVVATWLTRQPRPSAWFIAAWSLGTMLIGSLLYWTNALQASQWMAASHNNIFVQKQYWRLWTTLFAHADMGHLLSNSLLFAVFGFFLSGYFGFWIFPLLAIFVGGWVNLIVLSQYVGDTYLIGMSGVVYAMGGIWLVLYLLLDQQRSVTQRILRSVGVALAVFMPSSAFDPQVSYGAHLVGFILGVLSGTIYYLLKKDEFNAAIVYAEVPPEEEIPGRTDLSEDEATSLGPPRI